MFAVLVRSGKSKENREALFLVGKKSKMVGIRSENCQENSGVSPVIGNRAIIPCD